MNIPFVDLQSQQRSVEGELNAAVQKILRQANFILGSEVGQFEGEFAAYCDAPYAVGVDSGLSALQLALEAYDIGSGDEVILPANTFIATAAAVTFAGARPVLVDMDPQTYNIAIDQIEAHITARTRAIIPVHLYGSPADMERILEIAEKHGLVVIEDACQAHGAFYKGKRAGSMGQAAAFSFYPAKNLGAAGDGGMVLTRDAKVAERIRAMRNCGQQRKYYHTETPYNHRLDTLQAAILSVKLKHLDAWNAARREHAALYNQLLQASSLKLPEIAANTEPVWHLYVVRTEARDELSRYLEDRGIHTAIHYPVPIHLQPYYHDLGYARGSFPVTEEYADQILSLPMFPELTDDAIRYVAQSIFDFETSRQAEPDARPLAEPGQD